METKFYRCPICGNILLSVADSGLVPMCCGQEMEIIERNCTDGKVEAHVPKVKCEQVACGEQKYKIDVFVGNIPHPMQPDHHINFVFLETEHGGQLAYLDLTQPAVAHFISNSKPRAVYAYCNKHGLWCKTPVVCP
ncbi:MAG: hypothetical protein KBT20_02315 [Bacteroidales bacterium]|nr:hypothetical protein [Candidatus Liminaster caballi]